MTKTHCGVLIGVDELRALSLKTQRGMQRIAGAASHELSSEERDAPGAALKTMLRKMKPVPPAAVLCLPKEQANLQPARLPSADPAELREMARFEAERNIPFNAERHSVGFHIQRPAEAGQTEVLLASADGPIVDRVLKAAQEAGITPAGLNISSACLMNAFLFAEPGLARTKTVLLASIGLSSLDLVFIAQGRALFSRSVPLGIRGLIKDWQSSQGSGSLQLDAARMAIAARMIDMNDLDRHYTETGGSAPPTGGGAATPPGNAARTWAGRLVQELRRSYDYARREMSCPAIEAIAVAGEGAILKNLSQYLYVNLNVEVIVLNPASKLPIEGDADMLKALPFGGLEMAVPLGAALQETLEGSCRIDLTPDAYYKKLESSRFLRRAAISGSFFLTALILGVIAFFVHGRNQRVLAEAYSRLNDQLYPYVTSLKEEDTKLTILEGFLDDPSNALAVLNTIAAYPQAPDRVSIKLVSYVKSEQAVIDGHAAEIPDLNNFAEYLRASGLFDSVTIMKQEARAALSQRPQLYDFHIQCAIPKYVPKVKQRKVVPIEELEAKEPRLKKGGLETEFVPSLEPVEGSAPEAVPEKPSGKPGPKSNPAKRAAGAQPKPETAEDLPQPEAAPPAIPPPGKETEQ